MRNTGKHAEEQPDERLERRHGAMTFPPRLVVVEFVAATPLIPPPETPQVTAGGAFDEKYSAYGDANVGGREANMPRSSRTSVSSGDTAR
jgi:hypothetical protein